MKFFSHVKKDTTDTSFSSSSVDHKGRLESATSCFIIKGAYGSSILITIKNAMQLKIGPSSACSL